MTWKDTLSANLKASAITDALTYVDESGAVNTVRGTFTDEYQDDLGGQTVRPRAYVDQSDLSGEVIGTLWEYGGTQYLARTVEPDGDGWAYVALEKQ